jgi:hypothetical protein
MRQHVAGHTELKVDTETDQCLVGTVWKARPCHNRVGTVTSGAWLCSAFQALILIYLYESIPPRKQPPLLSENTPGKKVPRKC